MKALEGVDGIERIRVSSIEPNLLTHEMIDFVLASDKFCNHFHIPLQSGSNAILRAMRRRYTTELYRSLIEYIKREDPNAGIGVDVISGFPGEADREFEETYRFLVDLPVTYLHAFTYSERPDTAAIDFPNSVDPKIRFERTERLRMLSIKKRNVFYNRFLGNTMPVLFEASSHRDSMSGLTSNYIRVEVHPDPSLINIIRDVLIIDCGNECCRGMLLESRSFFPKRRRNFSDEEIVKMQGH